MRSFSLLKLYEIGGSQLSEVTQKEKRKRQIANNHTHMQRIKKNVRYQIVPNRNNSKKWSIELRVLDGRKEDKLRVNGFGIMMKESWNFG